MPVNWEAYQEADKRGILPPDKKALYDEALKRGLFAPPATAYDIRDQERPDVGVKEGLSITGDVLGTFMGGGLAKSLKFAPRVLPYAGRVLGSLAGGRADIWQGRKSKGSRLI